MQFGNSKEPVQPVPPETPEAAPPPDVAEAGIDTSVPIPIVANVEHEEATRSEIEALFDREFYLWKNPDVAESGLDPIEHYLNHGWKERRDPSPNFDTRYYLDQHMALMDPPVCPLIHFLEVGRDAGLSVSAADAVAKARALYDQVVGGEITNIWQKMGVNIQPLKADLPVKLIIAMFSGQHYRSVRDITEQRSEFELLSRYLAFDLPMGLTPGPIFDDAYYRNQVARLGLKPITEETTAFVHWLEHGIASRVSPTPLYVEEEYSELNRDIDGWLGWKFEHFICHGIDEGRQFLRLAFFANAQAKRSGTQKSSVRKFLEGGGGGAGFATEIEEMRAFSRSDLFSDLVRSARELDPSIGSIKTATRSFLPPWHDSAFAPFSELLRLLPKGKITTIILMPFCKLGGADFVAGVISDALTELGSVLVIRTEQPDWARPDWFPKDVETLDVSRQFSEMDLSGRARSLYEMVRVLQPDRVVNVNSRAGFEFILQYGQRARTFTTLAAYYFCADMTPEGVETGYPVWYFANLLPYLHSALIDNRALAVKLIDRYRLSGEFREKVSVMYTPAMNVFDGQALVDKQIEGVAFREKPVVLWAGRLDRQKRFDLVVKIAREMPEVSFQCWGKAVLDSGPDLSNLPENLQLHEPFEKYEDLPLVASDAWLYTSSWDGIPTILIECGQMGIPIVASSVGGVGELIDESTGWPLKKNASVDDYVRRIREMLDAPEQRRERAHALQRKVRSQHDRATYKGAIAKRFLSPKVPN